MIVVLEWLPWAWKSTLVDNIFANNFKSVKKILHKPFLRSEVLDIIEKSKFDCINDSLTILIKKLITVLKQEELEKIINMNKWNDLIIIDRYIHTVWWLIYAYFYPYYSPEEIHIELLKESIFFDIHVIEITIPFLSWIERFENSRWRKYDDNTKNIIKLMLEYLYNIEKKWLIKIHRLDGLKNKNQVYEDFEKLYDFLK